MDSSNSQLESLFPLPSQPPSPLSPTRLPGVTHGSGLALLKTLKENHRRWHIFFNNLGFHNHMSHHLLAIYQLGASGPLLEAAYQSHVSSMRPAFESPGSITEKNFHEHLGDEKYYNAYLKFFSSILVERGAEKTIEEYIFSAKMNVSIPAVGHPSLEMLSRFLSGLFHPMIHTGYGAEFGLLGMVAEGLAQTALQKPFASVLIPSSLSQYAVASSTGTVSTSISRLVSLLPSLTLNNTTSGSMAEKEHGMHALTVVAQILHNDDFTPAAIGIPSDDKDDNNIFQRVLEARGERLMALASAWTVNGTNPEEVASKIEELIWVNVVLYAVGGWAGRKSSPTGQFKGDFFLLHLVTSVLFLPSLTAYLSPTSTSILLRTYFNNSLAWWIARGRPALPIRDFYASVSERPQEHGAPYARPGEGTLTPADPSPNPWLPILQTTLEHPDDHLCKLQRALAHFASLYGIRPEGHFGHLAKVSGASLDGAELLDGTLFVRAASLSADRLGWMREGEKNKGWDFDGFF
ncbi:uncharacterized protein FIBRA_02220 [Fibroporia radiculosa]|uniref:DUF4243 domain-containing protein n=1 Tax=Fibroporia radiculosa TaxID=599839 RepID=J4HUJ9_9APHY|nr:uncharacterized protein FIBRA_02220 [Fibroporia radiculosa]CCM00192.1 predicted protein [Fibroporia radiculosa]